MHHTTSSSQFGGIPQHGKPGEIGIVGPSSETDVITLGLLLNSMVKSIPSGHPQTQWRCSWPSSAGLLGRRPFITPSSSYPRSHVLRRLSTRSSSIRAVLVRSCGKLSLLEE
jgi:hypothetical protein